jgi:AcrR family transcriptional regulator
MTLATPRINYSPQNTARARLLTSAKHLFSVVGYENTTMHAICREAQVSEAELISNFGSQQEILRSIFEEGWKQLIARLTRLQEVASPKKKLKNLVRAAVQLFTQDAELRDLFLLEGRRMDGSEMMILTPSYTDLVALVDSLIAEVSPGSPLHQVQLLRSCLMGAVEGVLRDIVSQERCGFPANFTVQQAEQFVPEVVDRLIPAAA